jgi:hypothetical protein
MSKRVLSICLLAAALCARPAWAAQNVANTSQKGSLLIFPLIVTDPLTGPLNGSANTFIEISNDETSPVNIECSYINEGKGRVDFDFDLTAKATASWDAATGSGIGAPPFPTNESAEYAPIPTGLPAFYSTPNLFRGELVCFATDPAGANQIAFNHLIGTATVVKALDVELDPLIVVQPKHAFRYNAWSFIARNAAGLPQSDNVIQGTPGLLALTGSGAGTYDACPAYNIANFNPNGATSSEGPVTGLSPDLETVHNDLSVVSCNQDLRQDFLLHLTKAQFTVWNENENSFTGAYECIDSVQTIPLGVNANLVARSNFDEATLRTPNARFQVQGISSIQCPTSFIPGPGLPPVPVPATENAGLLGVLTSTIGIQEITPVVSVDTTIGSTTQTAGSMVGFVKWDPANGTVPSAKTHS